MSMSVKHRLRLWIARSAPRSYVLRLRHILFGKQKLFIIGGHAGTHFDDNARALAEHLANEKNCVSLFVRRRGYLSKDVMPGGVQLIRMGSLRAAIAIATADAIFFSHSLKDLVKDVDEISHHCPAVYMGHGVWGLKRIERRGFGPPNSYFTHTIAASSKECRLKAEVLGIDEIAVLPIGLPKHDRIIKIKSLSVSRVHPVFNVLYVPTWRDWLSGADKNGEEYSKYLNHIALLLKSAPKYTDDNLILSISVMVHKNSMNTISDLKRICEMYRVDMVIPDNNIMNTLADSDALISDYSSIIWDYSIFDKPIARYTFDEDLYKSRTGSYPNVDLDRHLPPIRDAPAVWEALLKSRDNADFAWLRSHYLPFSDGRSCAKLMKEIGFGSLRNDI